MSNKGRNKRLLKQNYRKKLKKLLVGGKIYLNMNSIEWQTGKVDGVNVKNYCVGYSVPKNTTAMEEFETIKKWHEINAIFANKPQINLETKVKKPKPKPKKTLKRMLKSRVILELVGTEL